MLQHAPNVKSAPNVRNVKNAGDGNRHRAASASRRPTNRRGNSRLADRAVTNTRQKTPLTLAASEPAYWTNCPPPARPTTATIPPAASRRPRPPLATTQTSNGRADADAEEARGDAAADEPARPAAPLISISTGNCPTMIPATTTHQPPAVGQPTPRLTMAMIPIPTDARGGEGDGASDN